MHAQYITVGEVHSDRFGMLSIDTKIPIEPPAFGIAQILFNKDVVAIDVFNSDVCAWEVAVYTDSLPTYKFVRIVQGYPLLGSDELEPGSLSVLFPAPTPCLLSQNTVREFIHLYKRVLQRFLASQDLGDLFTILVLNVCIPGDTSGSPKLVSWILE